MVRGPLVYDVKVKFYKNVPTSH